MPPSISRLSRTLLLMVGIAVLMDSSMAVANSPMLTAREKALGWSYLFDGSSLSEFRVYGKNSRPTNWNIAGGIMTPEAGAPALVSIGNWINLELTFEYRATEEGEGAVYFRVSEDFPKPGQSGPGLFLGALNNPQTGGAPGLMKPQRQAEKPYAGDWNQVRILVETLHVEYSINNSVVLSYVLDSAEFRKFTAASAYSKTKDYGLIDRGSIVFEGRGIVFRNIKIREIP